MTCWHACWTTGVPLAFEWTGGTVTQRSIEMVIGRLVTDEEFRETFLSDPHKALGDLVEQGTHLSPSEMAALIATNSALWLEVAEHIDERLQKASLKA
jgi:hypothetical protein